MRRFRVNHSNAMGRGRKIEIRRKQRAVAVRPRMVAGATGGGQDAAFCPQPGFEAPRGEPACLGGLLLANDQHLHLLMRSAWRWRCRRLSARRGNTAFGVSKLRCRGRSRLPACISTVGGGTHRPTNPLLPLPSKPTDCILTSRS